MKNPLSDQMLKKMDAYWRAANYLSVGQLYLRDNPLLREKLKFSHIKPVVVGHWGIVPEQNFIYVHLNRIIVKYDLDMIYVADPGHGGPALVSNTYLEGTYSEVHPNISQDEYGMKKLFIKFSFLGGTASYVSHEYPGSIHEGGEPGYSLGHAFGAVFDNPALIVACVIGDDEAETGPLATAWYGNKFINPVSDGAVLPFLHLNGYKISDPNISVGIHKEELVAFLKGCGWKPYFVEGDDPEKMHQIMAAVLDKAVEDIRGIQENAKSVKDGGQKPWPMIVFRSPKGWTGPKEVDEFKAEGTFHSYQVPILVDAKNPENVGYLEKWMKSYRAEELFDESGCLIPELAELAPKGNRRMGANPHASGGILLRDLRMPASIVPPPDAVAAKDIFGLGGLLRDVSRLSCQQRNFRIFSPDETLSNQLGSIFETQIVN